MSQQTERMKGTEGRRHKKVGPICNEFCSFLLQVDKNAQACFCWFLYKSGTDDNDKVMVLVEI